MPNCDRDGGVEVSRTCLGRLRQNHQKHCVLHSIDGVLDHVPVASSHVKIVLVEMCTTCDFETLFVDAGHLLAVLVIQTRSRSGLMMNFAVTVFFFSSQPLRPSKNWFAKPVESIV